MYVHHIAPSPEQTDDRINESVAKLQKKGALRASGDWIAYESETKLSPEAMVFLSDRVVAILERIK